VVLGEQAFCRGEREPLQLRHNALNGGLPLERAVTLVSALIVTVQSPVPEQAPTSR